VSLAQEAVRRSLSRRQDEAEAEVRRIIKAGRDLLTKERNARVADIVQASGVSNDAFYRYFKSKDDFVAAVIEDGGTRLADYLGRQMAKRNSNEDKLRAAIEAVMSQAMDPSVAIATKNVRANETGRQRETGVRLRVEEALAQPLRGLLVDLGASEPDRDSRVTACLLLSTVDNFLSRDVTPSKKDLDHLAAFVLAAVRR